MTRIIAVAMVKDEIDILPHVINHYDNEGIDAFYILDNGSTDGTLEWLKMAQAADMHAGMFVYSDPDPAYYQATKMNALIRKAVEMEETHFDQLLGYSDKIILPFDADEMFYSLYPNISLHDALVSMPTEIATATVYDHVPHPTDDQNELNPLRRMTHRMPHIKSPPSVAFRYHPDAALAMGNHSVSYPGDAHSNDFIIGVRHFQYRSLEQYMRKLRNGKKAYDATDLPEMFGAHWREGGAKSDDVLTSEWNDYMAQPSIYDPAPYKGTK